MGTQISDGQKNKRNWEKLRTWEIKDKNDSRE